MKLNKILITSIAILILISGCTQTTQPSGDIAAVSETTSAQSSCLEESSSFIGNPAAFYCTDVMGYDYQTVTLEDGSQKGQCIMPDDGEVCDQWAFYAGECGAAHSYCAQEGMTIETRSDGQDPYSKTYGVCTGSEARSEFRISDIIEFNLTTAEEQNPEDKTRSAQLPELTEEMRASLPDHFDWRDVNGDDWMTPVKNQGDCGSCWAFSAVGVMEPYYNFINDNPDLNLDLSEENLVSDCVMYGCDGGHSYTSLEYIRDIGIVDEICMPYTATDSACATMCADPERYTVEQVVWEYYAIDVDLLRYFIVNYGPVSVYLKMGGYWENDILYCNALEEWDINHAVVVVGYDDVSQYWIVKNSWGNDYKDNGYFKVGYDQCNINTTLYAYLPSNVLKTYLPLISKPGTPFTTIPDITYPSEGDVVNTLKPTITWNLDNSLHDASFIYYQISPDYNLHQYSGGYQSYGTAFTGSHEIDENLKEGTTYYMHAAYDYLNMNNYWYWLIGPYSEPFTFTTGTGFDIPGKTELISPENYASLTDTNVVLKWNEVTNADYYEGWVWWLEYFEPYWYQMGINFLTDSNTINLSDAMLPNTEYYWYVRAANDVAWGEYSEQWSFTTGAQASGTPRSEEGTEYDLFIKTEDGEIIPYELFLREND
jgi:C1A family cysteine protease